MKLETLLHVIGHMSWYVPYVTVVSNAVLIFCSTAAVNMTISDALLLLGTLMPCVFVQSGDIVPEPECAARDAMLCKCAQIRSLFVR